MRTGANARCLASRWLLVVGPWSSVRRCLPARRRATRSGWLACRWRPMRRPAAGTLRRRALGAADLVRYRELFALHPRGALDRGRPPAQAARRSAAGRPRAGRALSPPDRLPLELRRAEALARPVRRAAAGARIYRLGASSAGPTVHPRPPCRSGEVRGPADAPGRRIAARRRGPASSGSRASAAWRGGSAEAPRGPSREPRRGRSRRRRARRGGVTGRRARACGPASRPRRRASCRLARAPSDGVLRPAGAADRWTRASSSTGGRSALEASDARAAGSATPRCGARSR